MRTEEADSLKALLLIFPAGRQELHVIMRSFRYLLGAAGGPPARRRRKYFGGVFDHLSGKQKRQRRPVGAKTPNIFAPAAGWGAFGGAPSPISCATVAARLHRLRTDLAADRGSGARCFFSTSSRVVKSRGL